MKIAFYLSLLLSVSLLAGCAGDPAAALARAGLKTVQLEPRVDSEQGMRFGYDPGNGGLSSALGAAIDNSTHQAGLGRMSIVMQTNHIIVAQMVHDVMDQAMQHHFGPAFTNGPADGIMLVSISQYGFDDGLSLTKKTPFIILHAELRTPSGHTIWSKDTPNPVNLFSDTWASWDDYEARPEKLRADWSTQIKYAVGKLVPDTSK